MQRSWKARTAPFVAAIASGALILAACGGGRSGGGTNTQAAATPAGGAAATPAAADASGGATANAATPAAAAAATPAAGGAASAATPAAAATAGASYGASGGAATASMGTNTATAAGAVTPAAAMPKSATGVVQVAPAAAPPVVAGGSTGAAQAGATDTGVDATTIKLGAVNMLGMPLGNILTLPQVRAEDATIKAINDKGGLYGRRMTFTSCDDGPGDLSLTKACVKKLAEQDHIFSMVTAFTWGSSGIHNDLAKYQMPLVGAWAYSQTEWDDPWMFPTHMSMQHESSNTGIWVAQHIKPKTYGLICLNSPEMQAACRQVRKSLDPTGAKMIKEIDPDITTADLSSEVLAMRLAAPQLIIHYVINPATIVKFMVDSATQGYYPPLGITGNHLGAEVLGSLFGSWPANRYWTNVTYKLWGADYMAVMAKYAPSNHGLNHHITQAGYVAINATATAMKKVGPNLTRKAFVDQLNQGYYYSDPDMGQRFIWTFDQRENPASGNCIEYMFKYTSANTVANADYSAAGFIPAPEGYVLHDTLDCNGMAKGVGEQ